MKQFAFCVVAASFGTRSNGIVRTPGTLAEQTNFRFEAFDLEIIHRAVSRWTLENGLGAGHQDTILAARHAFHLYREGMEEDELLEILHNALSRRH